MTSQFSFPPPTFGLESQSSDGASIVQDQIRATELQMAQMEKQEILVYEGYLANNEITEANSLLLSQVISLDPKGILSSHMILPYGTCRLCRFALEN